MLHANSCRTRAVYVSPETGGQESGNAEDARGHHRAFGRRNMEAGIDSRSAGQRKRENGMRSWQKPSFLLFARSTTPPTRSELNTVSNDMSSRQQTFFIVKSCYSEPFFNCLPVSRPAPGHKPLTMRAGRCRSESSIEYNVDRVPTPPRYSRCRPTQLKPLNRG